MNKPKWLSAESWAKFKAQHMNNSGHIKCLTCDATSETATMSADHIDPRVNGGTDDVANLQPMCVSCNSRKNKFPDNYWSKRFYFDRVINTSKLRVSQNDFVLGPVLENADFFSRHWSEINGKLFSYVQIVGAGKTLGMFSLPFALNQVINNSRPNTPRVDRMLIVTKESGLRSQIYNELKSEPTDLGIIIEPPRVIEITSSTMLTSTDDDHDIAVMCPQMIWPKIDKDDAALPRVWSPHIEDVLRRYRMIVFDEMHYSSGNINRLIKVASQALVFGFTASPLDADGEIIEDIVLMGQPFGYTEAIINDQSMKGIW